MGSKNQCVCGALKKKSSAKCKPCAMALDGNPNWKGGRSIASNGYVLIKQPDHPRADVRGYVYEHILNTGAEKGQIVHHEDENPTNNQAYNLSVCNSTAEHKFNHRKPGSNKKGLLEQNSIVSCGCRCGTTFLRYDQSNRPRIFVSGHNRKGTGKHGC